MKTACPWAYQLPALERAGAVFYGADMVAYAAIAATVVSTAVTAYSAVQAGDAQKASYDYNAKIQQAQADIAKQQADAQAQTDAQNARRHQGEIAASFAAAGVDPNAGTPLEVASDQAASDELTRQTTLYKGKIAAWGNQAQAGIDVFEGDQAAAAGESRAFSTILSGGAKAAGGIYNLSNNKSVSW